jgi:cysteine-rich repeat protein
VCYTFAVSRSLFFFLSLTFASACAAKKDDPPKVESSITACVPNQTLVCLCGLDEGTQRCTDDGQLTPCDCPKPKTTPAEPAPPPPPPATCGNGTLDPGEACDDGNTKSGDGCSATCMPDGAPASAQTCPGQPVAVWKGSPVELAASTATYKDESFATCDDAYGPDRIFAITPKDTGILQMDLTFENGFYAVVSVRDTCNETSSEKLCVQALGEPVSRVVPVTKDVPVYLFVDGSLATDKGAFSASLKLL